MKASQIFVSFFRMNDKLDVDVHQSLPDHFASPKLDYDSVSMCSSSSTVCESDYVAAGIEKYNKSIGISTPNLPSTPPTNQMINLNISVVNNGKKNTFRVKYLMKLIVPKFALNLIE